jgi:hypothetical protein
MYGNYFMEYSSTSVTLESDWSVQCTLYCFLKYINLLAPELFFLILAHPVYKM